MKIKLNLNTNADVQRTLEIRGDEPWLQRLYNYFPKLERLPTKLEGSLQLSQEKNKFFIKGRLNFQSPAHCKRCWEIINPPKLFKKINISYDLANHCLEDLEEDYSYGKENFFVDSHLDLEPFFYDTILLARPSDILPESKTKNGTSFCLFCHCTTSSKEVHSSTSTQEYYQKSPFAKLKDWN